MSILENESPEIVGSKNPTGNFATPQGNQSSEEIRKVVEEVGAKHASAAEAPRRGPGRPRKNQAVGVSQGGASAGPSSRGMVAQEPSRPATPPVDPTIIAKTVKTMCRTVDGIVVRKIHRTVLTLTKDNGLAESLAVDVGMTKEECELIGDLSGQVCVQYGWAGQHAPAVLLGVVTVGYGVRVAMGFGKLNELIGELKKQNATRTPTISPSELQATGNR